MYGGANASWVRQQWNRASGYAAYCKPYYPALLLAGICVPVLLLAFTVGYSNRSMQLEDEIMGRCAFKRSSVPVDPYAQAWEERQSSYDPAQVASEYAAEARAALRWAHVLLDASLNDAPLTASELQVLAECKENPGYFHMFRNERCTALWLRHTRLSRVESISHVLAVMTEAEVRMGITESKKSQNGGFRMHFADGELGYFKVCSGTKNSESHERFEREIVAFHLDRILGFYRVPAVSVRAFEQHELMALAAHVEQNVNISAATAMQTIFSHCSAETRLQGASVGWSPFELHYLENDETSAVVDFLLSMDQKKISKLLRHEYAINGESPPEDRFKPLESMSLLLFTSITGNMRKTGHNLFTMTPRPSQAELAMFQGMPAGDQTIGPLCFIDNDRSSWSRPTAGNWPGLLCKDYNTPVLQVCKFPRTIALRILALSQPVNDTGADTSTTCSQLTPDFVDHQCEQKEWSTSVGSLLLQSLRGYRGLDQGPLLTCTEAYVLDTNVQWWANHINTCIAKHGARRVLIPELWS